jgi:glyoxylase I family protein
LVAPGFELLLADPLARATGLGLRQIKPQSSKFSQTTCARFWRLLEADEFDQEAREKVMFKRIDHVEIVTDQLDRTIQFYTEVLEFSVKIRDRIKQSGLGVPIDLVYLDLGGTVVELISYHGAAVDPAPSKEHLGYRMIALEVDDMQNAIDYLKTKGVDLVWGPRVRETYARAEICDPNGFHIELRQWFK